MNRMLMLATSYFFILSAAAAAAPGAAPAVRKVDPPWWWIEHTVNPVRLLLRGENLQGAEIHSTRADIHIEDPRVNDRGTAVFASLRIDPDARPGEAGLTLLTGEGSAAVPFRLEPPLTDETFHGARGIDADDVIYLIMTDRFADGDPDNDVPPMAPRAATDRRNPRAYHGGDLRGVIERLDYLRELGVTALWLTPWYDNANTVYDCDQPWCPYTYYHGYHTIDYYAVEDHFGTLDTLRELAEEAHARGIKLIQDQISNHVALRHPWAADPPLPDWFHGSTDGHFKNTFQVDLLSSPHAAAADRAVVLDGWFSDDSPDLNQDEPEVARYLIQNALWWVGTTGIDGIREDTAQFVPRRFLRELTGALHRQHPRLTMVGEVLDIEPVHTSYYLGGRAGWDGVDTGLDSIFDFPTWSVAVNAFTAQKPMTDLRRVLRADALYPDPSRLTTLSGNHDLRRFVSWPGASLDRARPYLAFVLSARGIPQLYYGDEIGMAGDGDPDNRRDFPGGFPGDRESAFTSEGRTPGQARLWNWTRDWLALRHHHSALRRGTHVDLDAQAGIYTFARRDETETVVVAFNRAEKPGTTRFSSKAIEAVDGDTLVPLLGEGEPVLIAGKQVTFTLPPCTAVCFKLRR
jgi:glycosidase